MTSKWKYSPADIFAAGPVVPVLVINDVEKAVPLAKALMAGGIGPGNYNDYLALKNVVCVGGSWLAPDDAIESGDWSRITQLAKEAVAGANIR